MRTGDRHFSLAWRLLVFEKRRLFAALAGVAFAVVLILVQIGFYNAMIASATKVHANLHADLVMIPSDFEYFGAERRFARVRLYEAAAQPEVTTVAPLYVSLMNFRNIDTGFDRSIMAIGVDPGPTAIQLPELIANSERLAVAGEGLFDRKSLAAYFGDVAGLFDRQGYVDTMVEGQPLRISETFSLGTSFIAYCTLMLGSHSFFALRPDLSPREPSIGLIRLAPGTDALALRDRLRADLSAQDVIIETREEFVAREANYWNTTAAIGFIFITGALMGVIVGAVIVYQILYTDVTDHLPEYATLKAMGYRDRYFIGLVLNQSLILSVLGFLPGVLISGVTYYYTAESTGYELRLTPGWTLGVWGITAAMCLFSGALALRRLRRADPSELFL